MENTATGVLKKALDLLKYISEADKPGGVTEISNALDMPKATVHRILNSLCDENVLLKTEDGRYRIGPTVLLWSSAYNYKSGVVDIAQPLLEALRDKTRETLHLSVYEHGRAQYAARFDSPQTVVLRWSRLGTELPLYCTAAGRAILSRLTDEEVADYLSHTELKARTKRTVVARDKLRAMLARFRTLGYAEENQENEENIRCVGAAIVNRHGKPVAAVSLTAPSFRFTDYDAVKTGPELARIAQEISAKL